MISQLQYVLAVLFVVVDSFVLRIEGWLFQVTEEDQLLGEQCQALFANLPRFSAPGAPVHHTRTSVKGRGRPQADPADGTGDFSAVSICERRPAQAAGWAHPTLTGSLPYPWSAEDSAGIGHGWEHLRVTWYGTTSDGKKRDCHRSLCWSKSYSEKLNKKSFVLTLLGCEMWVIKRVMKI